MFRNDATVVDKVLAYSLLALVALAGFGVFKEFNPTERVATLAARVATCVSIFYLLTAFYHPERHDPKYGWVKRFGCNLAICAVSWVITWLALALGFVAAATSVAGSNIELQARVTHPPYRSYGKGCRLQFNVDYIAPGTEPDTLCISEEQGSVLRTGQQITVMQRRSQFGFYVVGFRIDG